MLDGPVEWVPVDLAGLSAAERFDAFRCETERLVFREEVERRAGALGLPPVRWPTPFPFDGSLAMRAATYAQGIGRAVAFALAAFRQAFLGGHALDEDFVLIAAAACEMHPSAMTKAMASKGVAAKLAAATAAASALGVRDLPAVLIDGRTFTGERALEDAGRELTRRDGELARGGQEAGGRKAQRAVAGGKLVTPAGETATLDGKPATPQGEPAGWKLQIVTEDGR